MDLASIQDETTVSKFRHFLEAQALTAALFRLTEHYLAEQVLLIRTGTIVDATIISASGSTKNQAQARDPEMASTKKGRHLTCTDRAFNRKSNRVRARVEHVCGVIKHLWGYWRGRYRGLAKNAAPLSTLLALANWYRVRRELAGA